MPTKRSRSTEVTDEYGLTLTGEQPIVGRPALSVEDDHSQRVRVILGGIIVILVAIAAQALLEKFSPTLKPYLWEFVPPMIERIIDGIIVAGTAVLILETPWLRSYLEDRIKSYLTTEVRTDFTSRVTDVNFLRRFKPSLLDNAEEAIRRASFSPNLPSDVDSFHSALRMARNKLDIWRTGYREKIVLGAVAGRSDVISISSETTWTYVNYGESSASIEQVLSENAYCVEGLPDDELFRVESLIINGIDRRADVNVQRHPDGGQRVEFRAAVSVNIPAMTDASRQGVSFYSKIVFLKQRAVPHTVRFYRPVQHMELSLYSTPHILPSLSVFGVGGANPDADIAPLVPFEREGNVFRWKYDGWFLPNHGWILIFPHPSVGSTPTSVATVER